MKTICHVGHTGTGDDTNRICESMEWLKGKGEQWPIKSYFLDLTRGQDFLAEKRKYDVVVLHFIFRGGFMCPADLKGELSQSPISSWSGWRKRIIQTGARFVFAFGGVAEISGTFICNLEGYKVHKIRTEDLRCFGQRESGHDGLWIFEKE